MLLTVDDIKKVFIQLIDGRLSREEADLWAFERMRAFDYGTLEFDPLYDENLLWKAITYLCGIDTMTAPGEYMHSIEEIKKTFEDNWNK